MALNQNDICEGIRKIDNSARQLKRQMKSILELESSIIELDALSDKVGKALFSLESNLQKGDIL